jgi:hypothetical protein
MDHPAKNFIHKIVPGFDSSDSVELFDPDSVQYKSCHVTEPEKQSRHDDKN